VTNTHVYSQILLSSGQPTRDQFKTIAQVGVQTVINLLPQDLAAAISDEKDLVEALGMRYVFIPVNWAAPRQADVDRFLAAMDAAKGRTVLTHCWINARASAFVYLYRVLRHKAPREAEYRALEKI
jgi:uncharacterized protein (TIGR01244 family)